MGAVFWVSGVEAVAEGERWAMEAMGESGAGGSDVVDSTLWRTDEMEAHHSFSLGLAGIVVTSCLMSTQTMSWYHLSCSFTGTRVSHVQIRVRYLNLNTKSRDIQLGIFLDQR